MKRKEKMAHSASLTCEYLGVCTGEGQFDALSSALSSRTVGFEWRVRAGAHGHTGWRSPQHMPRASGTIFIEAQRLNQTISVCDWRRLS